MHFKRLNNTLASINPWHYVWITIILSEFLSLVIDSFLSYYWWGYISTELLVISSITAFLVPLTIAPIIIFLVLQIGKMREELLHKQVDEEWVNTQRLESLGLLAGGIAHGFNNALTGILANISFLKMRIQPDDVLYPRIEKAEEASQRAKTLARQLLTFSRGGVPIKRTVDIKPVLRENIDMALKGSNTVAVYHIENDLWPVEGDAGQLAQVFTNLARNAAQAVADGSTINVSARNTWIGEKDNLPLKKGNHILVTVKDHGTGISHKDLPKVFDPYFTTKEGKSGLGLTAAYSIIKGHGGYIKIVSEQGAGTIVSVFLPASLKGVFKNGMEELVYDAGSEKILLMDEQKLVRESAAEMLKEIGYHVVTARDGKEAVDLYRQAIDSAKPFDAVIVDLTVSGGMGGDDAIKALLKIDPHVNAIISSGYSQDAVMANYRDYGFRGVIEKPYTINELIRVLKETMASGNRLDLKNK